MDIDDKENYLFMLIGNIYIMDDSLGKYCDKCIFFQNVMLHIKEDVTVNDLYKIDIVTPIVERNLNVLYQKNLVFLTEKYKGKYDL